VFKAIQEAREAAKVPRLPTQPIAKASTHSDVFLNKNGDTFDHGFTSSQGRATSRSAAMST
jgi:hypothetical protein